MPILKVKNLTWEYALGGDKTLKGIDLEIDKGGFLGIVGPNEAGKTTFGRAISGLIPDQFNGEMGGHVIINGLDTRENGMDKLAGEAGMVFSNPIAQITGARLTVEEEIAFGLEELGVEREEMRKRVKEIMDWMELEEAAKRSPNQVSGGQQQKIALASLLVMEPEVLILDEPTSMLDPIGTKRVFDALYKMKKRKNITTILISHKLEKMARFADKCIVFHDGKIKERGTPKEIFTKRVDNKFMLEKYDMETLPITKMAYKLKKDGIWEGELPILVDEAEEDLKKSGLK